MIHIWASKGSWRSVQMLVKNLGKEGLQPDHQTYAGLLQTCGQMKDRRKTERILVEMDLKVCQYLIVHFMYVTLYVLFGGISSYVPVFLLILIIQWIFHSSRNNGGFLVPLRKTYCFTLAIIKMKRYSCGVLHWTKTFPMTLFLRKEVRRFGNKLEYWSLVFSLF